MAFLLTEPFLSIVGGGLAAAVITIIFSVSWDWRKQKLSEDWEFRRYHANQIHHATFGVTEAFFSAKAELYFLTATLETMLASLNQLGVQADAIIRQQGGPQLTVAELEQRKAQALQPFQTYNQQQVNIRWNQYEQKAKDLHAKVEVHLMVLQPLIPTALHADILAMFEKLSAPFFWDLPHAKEKLQLFEENLGELSTIREKLTLQIEKKLGIKPQQKN
jgi:hypothetical protein